MATLTELAGQIMAARATKKEMSIEVFEEELQMVYLALKDIQDGKVQRPSSAVPTEEPKPLKINFKQIFKKDEVICMICNKGFKTLKRHLSKAHGLKPGEYRKQFGIPSTQSLAAKSYSDSRRQMALDKGLGAGLVKFRADKAAKKVAVPAVKTKAPVPAPMKKAAVPAVKKKAPVPAVKVKAAVPTVNVKAAVPAKVAKKK